MPRQWCWRKRSGKTSRSWGYNDRSPEFQATFMGILRKSMSSDLVDLSSLGQVVTGKTPSTKHPRFFDGEYPFITPSDLDWRTYYCRSTERTVTEEARKHLTNQFIPGDAIMVTCIGNTIGKCGISSGVSLTNQQINAIIPYPGVNPKFVYYLLIHNRNLIRSFGLGGGSATPILNKTGFKSIRFRVPSKCNWNRIASILSAYDDLIENNRRRIQLLEQSARLLYKEWFVHLRFPGHERVRIKDGVPEGWARKPLGEVAATNVKSYKTGGLPNCVNYIDISGVDRGRIVARKPVLSAEAPGRARRIVRSGDTIWSNVRPNLRAYALVLDPDECDVFSTGFTVLSPVTVPFVYLYLSITTDEFIGHLVNHTTGASYPAVRPDDFERAIVLIPSIRVLEVFQERTEPMYRLVKILEKEIGSLSKARDRLLPHLLSDPQS